MKTNTLRMIAELNLSPLVRVSKESIAASVLTVMGYVFMTSDICFLFFGAAVLLADRHIRKDEAMRCHGRK